MLKKPEKNEYPEWYEGYVQSVSKGNIIELMEIQLKEAANLLNEIPKEKELYRYEDGKWSIKELLGHINDAERILSYRGLRFIRGDKTNIEQYDHNEYVVTGNFDEQNFDDMKKEFRFLRKATLSLFKTVKDDQWMFKGISGGQTFTLRAMAYIIVGHVNHHLKIIKERYL